MEQYFQDDALILKAEPIGEYDRRLVLLTKDHGKISAFAKGARRPTNKLMGSTDMFCFGLFKFYAGQNSYSLVDASVKNYFGELRDDMNGAMYGMYFLEVMEYMTRENNDEEQLLKLLYQSLRAIVSPEFNNKLVRAIFEIKTMVLQGEWKSEIKGSFSETALYAVDYIVKQKPEKLFSFGLKESVLNELILIAEDRKRTLWHHEFNSEEMLKILEI